MAEQTTERPEVCTDEHLEFLDRLRESGATNMFGARPYLLREFPDLTKDEGLAVVVQATRGERAFVHLAELIAVEAEAPTRLDYLAVLIDVLE